MFVFVEDDFFFEKYVFLLCEEVIFCGFYEEFIVDLGFGFDVFVYDVELC